MFYVTQKELCHLTARTKQLLDRTRANGNLPAAMGPGEKWIYDIDDPTVRNLMVTFAAGTYRQNREEAVEYQKAFFERRRSGEVVCAMTGEPDELGEFESFTPVDPALDTEELNKKRVETDIKHKEKQIEKIDLALTAMKGGLIEREYVQTWIVRYIGTLHSQHLELPSTGICDDLYAAAHRIPDSRAAIKEMEKILGQALSDILKGATATMEKNPL